MFAKFKMNGVGNGKISAEADENAATLIIKLPKIKTPIRIKFLPRTFERIGRSMVMLAAAVRRSNNPKLT